MTAVAVEEGLAVQDLHVRYGDVHAVRGVSFSVAPGETLALVGESGCGKSSTALAIARLLPAGAGIEGRAEVEGFDLATARGRQLREARGRIVAYMPQDAMAALNPVQSAGRQIAEVLSFRRDASRSEAAAGAVRLLDEVGIQDPNTVAHRYAHQLSGGMRQRVMLAIALAGRPRVLIADEPTTALDVTVQAGILALVRALVIEDRMALVWITHDIGVVAEVADSVAVMYGGRIVEQGPVQTIFEQPSHPYTRALVSSPRQSRFAAPKAPFDAIPGSPPVGAFPGGCPFHPRCPVALPRCSSAMPETTTVAPLHTAACHQLGGSS
ncbi:MAG TPA: ABC transporter ATP-binding protein [Solirubrobacteraceae bacterium]|nr:ABC transporter ATP-binding protein [Solirubrobacteraceae bacterium]